MGRESVRRIESARPFGTFATKYREAGFVNPIPLPPKKKSPPPDEYTGHNAKTVTDYVLTEWMDRKPKCNIGIRLASVELDDEMWDVLGIDVDHHPEDLEDPKNGGDQLLSLEKKLGPLPPTWISSARTNGIAGIRLYLVPTGLAWKGKAATCIDVICTYYRFMVVYPSFHPNGPQYLWYPPGFKPDGDFDCSGREDWDVIPPAKRLARLSNSWIDFLSNGQMPYTRVPLDMDSTDRQLKHWAGKALTERHKMCDRMQRVLSKEIAAVEDSPGSHPVLTDGHYALLKCGVEGCTGWATAIREFEKHWRADVLERGKRTARVADSEIERSILGALRKIKGQADESARNGIAFVTKQDRCGKGRDDMGPKPVDAYENNDRGNAEHFLDIFGERVLFVPNVLAAWLIWNGLRWNVDDTEQIKTMFGQVHDRQMAFHASLAAKADADKKNDKLRKLAEHWFSWAKQSGEAPRVRRAIETSRSVRQGISVKFEDLDSDRRALGADGKVVRIDPHGKIRVVENERKLLITKNIGHQALPLEKHRGSRGFELFFDFLGRFKPMEDMHYFQKLCGSVLLGDVSNKFAIFFWGPKNTGKSTMLELLQVALGDYADTRNADIFKGFHLNPALASALPLRLVAIHELGDAAINSELFKTLTGGDRVQVELKGSNKLVVAKPQFTIIVDTNTIPRVPQEDSAFRDRLRVIRFKHTATAEELGRGKSRQAELLNCAGPVVFSWLLEGASRAVRDGLDDVPDEIRLATTQFSSQLSDVGEFLRDSTRRKEGEYVSHDLMYEHFRMWAFDNNFDMRNFTKNRLTRRLKDLELKTIARKMNREGRVQQVTTDVWCDIELVKHEGA